MINLDFSAVFYPDPLGVYTPLPWQTPLAENWIPLGGILANSMIQWHVIENVFSQIICQKMLNYIAPNASKITLNHWWLGLRPRPRGSSLQRSLDSLVVMGWGYEICEFPELLGMPGCVPVLTGNNIISFAIIRNFLFLNNQTVFRK